MGQINGKITGANKGLPKAGLKFFDWAFVQGSRLVILLNFCAKNPAFGKPQNVVSNPLRSLLTTFGRLSPFAASRRYADSLQQTAWQNSFAFVSSIRATLLRQAARTLAVIAQSDQLEQHHRMKGRTLILVIIIWIIWKLIEHYWVPYFFVPFLWLGLSLMLLIILVIQLAKLIKERKSITKLRIYKVIAFLVLFYLTFYRWTFDKWIEKADWYILYNKRMEIIDQVKTNKLKPNVSWNNWICELPYEFPIVSHGGNDIGISKSQDNETMTITFFVFRNFFSAPSTKFIYTTRAEDIKYYDELIADNPADNWKLEKNWYRILSE